jgi:hypothetical protein
MSKFERSKNLPFPLIYRTFKARDKDSDALVQYRIQDLAEEDFARAVALLAADYAPEETLFKCRGVADDKESLNEICNFWHRELKKRTSVGCYKVATDDLVGVNLLIVYEKNFPNEAENQVNF